MTSSPTARAPFRPLASPADLRAVMRTDFEVSPQQWAAISAPLTPAVVIAGAGSGKTSLMAARVVYLVVTGTLRPDQVLGLTFTTKAAGELRTRIREALDAAGFSRGGVSSDGDDETLEPTVSTYNAYASALLAEHGLRIGHEPDSRVIADAARYQLAGRVIDRHTRQVRELSDHPPTVIDYLLTLDGSLAEHLVTPAQLRDFDASAWARFEAELSGNDLDKVRSAFVRRGEALALVEDYRDFKRSLGLIDFSDQIALAAQLADRHRDVGAIERDKFAIVLLDEYQDTSVAQALMLSRLFSGPDQVSGRGHPVTAVGDPHQAIYGWRGASVSNILRFGEDFPTGAGAVDVPSYPLTVNRRSDVRILQTANALAAPLLDKFPAVRPLEPGRDDPGRVQVMVHESYDAELAWLGQAVHATHAGRSAADPDAEAGPGVPWREIGVLVRDNKHAADVFDALTAAEIPVEIVGLKGLLRLPEVAEVLSMLTLVSDLTANAQLLGLLTGPRWAVGPRDLALLGQRARDLGDARHGRSGPASRSEELSRAVAGADPSEVVALADALEDPGDLPYSAAARTRFTLLAAELRLLRTHAGEPLLELCRRIIDVCGIDVELASSVSPAARARRENLDLFVKSVAEFQAVDGAVTLPALLAWLEAEQDGEGLDVATPSAADSVKLLTVHRAKGLEWDVVFLVGAGEGRFPHTRSRGLWPTRVEILPTPLRGDARDLPALAGHDSAALKRLAADTVEHQAVEELRLGYVAFTRARHELVVSSYVWVASRKTGLAPSPYQRLVRDLVIGWGGEPLAWREAPEKSEPNPLLDVVREVAWPATGQTAETLRRLDAAQRVADHLGTQGTDDHTDEPALDVVGAATVAEWDADLDRLWREATADRSAVVEVTLPASLSATALAALRHNPERFARELVRPMPKPPSAAARFGTRFHAWVEARFGQQDLIDPDDLPGRADAGIDDFGDLVELIERFEAGPFGDRAPHRIEAPFALVLAGQVVRGRIDAIYREPDGSYLVVDWKTSRGLDSDPMQLAVYRVAWAELAGVDLGQVRAAFYYVRTGDLVEPEHLPDRAALEQIVLNPS